MIEAVVAPVVDPALRTRLVRVAEDVVEGHVVDPTRPDRRFVVELMLNDVAVRVARAGVYDADLAAEGIGDGCYGFTFHLDAALLPQLRTVAVRVANLDTMVGETLHLDQPRPLVASAAAHGHVQWAGGLRLTGWVERSGDDVMPMVEFRSDDTLVATARADRWARVVRGEVETVGPGFDVVLPAELADGRPKSIEVHCDGRLVSGSPVALVAFPDGLEAFLAARAEVDAEAPRGRIFDALFPGSLPFGEFEAWSARFPIVAPARPTDRPVALALVGSEEDAEKTLAGPDLADENWVAGALASTSGPTRFDPEDLRRFVEEVAADSDVVVFLLAGSTLRPGALDLLIDALEAAPGATVATCDLLLDGGDGRLRPIAGTAFDYERALEQGQGALCFAMRTSAVAAAAARGVDGLYRLLLEGIDGSDPHTTSHVHVPGFAVVVPPFPVAAAAADLAEATRAHLEARDVLCEVDLRSDTMLPAVRVIRGTAADPVTLVVIARGRASDLWPAIAALEATAVHRDLALVVVATSTGPADEAVLAELEQDEVRVVRVAAGTSIARRVAAGVALAETELICIYDSRLRPAADDWLEEMAARIVEPGVGAVGPVVTGPSGVVVEAGRVLTPLGAPLPAFVDRRGEDGGYGDLLRVAHRVSAVGCSCLMTRRADFDALGGFDAVFFPDHLGDVDYCLRLQSRGKHVILAPDARLGFAEPVRAGEETGPWVASREREVRLLRTRWLEVVANDPFYSPLLNLGGVPYAGLAWPPRDRGPRMPILEVPTADLLGV